jgi:hypothetical protein
MTVKSKITIVSDSYTEVKPFRPYEQSEPVWHDGMVSGNGIIGVVCSGSPYSETLVYQNINFIIPSGFPRVIPAEVGAELHEARQSVIRFDDSWDVNGRVRTYDYAYHPGYQMRLDFPLLPAVDYKRQTDYEKAEVSVGYRNEKGNWNRRTFVSREDNVIITELTQSDAGAAIDVTISIDDLSFMHKFNNRKQGIGSEIGMPYKRIVDEDGTAISLIAHYPAFQGSELRDGGYAGITRVLLCGGSQERIGTTDHPAIEVRGAKKVCLITALDRTYQMGGIEDFADRKEYGLLKRLDSELENVIRKYQDEQGCFSYEQAMKPHQNKQSEMFHAVAFRLGRDEDKDKDLSNEELLQKQKNSRHLLDAMVERAYLQGRYVQICCAGVSFPRLCGLWSGEWNPGWFGAYTMDANVNIQSSGMNTGNIREAGIGYINFVLKQVEDWKENAKQVYGMDHAIQVPVNTDGNRAMMVEYDIHYPFQYWNAGASWMVLPIYEFWKCFGNCRVPIYNGADKPQMTLD